MKLSITEILREAYRRGQEIIPQGAVATYIPELAKADRDALGISLCTREGLHYSIGQSETRFTMQSVSKIVTLIVALERLGTDEVFRYVGMEPSGEAFNSLVELDLKSNRPYNPMVNSGAITVASLLVGKVSFDELADAARLFCSDPGITFNSEVYDSERNNMSRNRSIAYLLESKGIIRTGVEESLDLYTRMCSLNVTARSLSDFGILLAMDGMRPDGRQLIDPRICEIVKTIMLTCGMYDESGEFAVHVGIPSKAGVGGGVLSAADNRMGIGLYGPALDEKGNCIAGKPVLEYLSRTLKLHIFDPSDITSEITAV